MLDTLAVKGEETARQGFENAVYDGTNDVQVETEKGNDSRSIIAKGESVTFIEYGTGVYYNGSGSYMGELPPGISGIGGYGKGLGKNDYWFYSGQPGNAGGALANGHPNSTITHGNPANNCMYLAGEEIIKAIPDAAKKVFHD